ncbi:IPT/TIG domain-containing protein [Flavivirga algicola]|uniref:Fibronectin type-III domain-containing protein n=1 Tax=Flavivirga algicola TaxID=2729136 RepID=A0ABX1RU23_9FLAO|nr:IPT/TIG domain-containing protein [Flavivirga algicola]NMH86573.1 hypothetical protein [Flavivirga algicola]
MIRHYTYKGILLMASVVMFNCGGSDSDGGDGANDKVLPPEAASLAFPLKDEECNQGNIVSPTESNVTFEWSEADNATSYTVVLTNLITNETQETTSNNTSTDIKILRGTPYSWHVVSKSNKTTTTATSETWRFYNAGEGVSNYAPFPAELVSPSMGSTTVGTTVSLQWTGSDIDNDIEEYMVYLDTANPPTNLQATTSDTSVNDIALAASTGYYWYVVTTDTYGNKSNSQVFEFTTQ